LDEKGISRERGVTKGKRRRDGMTVKILPRALVI
jgi:hypothetical protein